MSTTPQPAPQLDNNDAGTVKGACGIPPETRPVDEPNLHTGTLGDKTVAHAVMAKVTSLWDNGSTISYSFFGGTKNQQAAVDLIAPEWTYYANLTLQRQEDNDEKAMVRIAFQPTGGSWSAVGKGALRIKDGKITMNLGWIEDSPKISATDRGTILHEWGHALGLMHEHQSPARGGALTLKEDEVYSYYHSTQGWDKSLIKSQILDVYNLQNVSNYSKLDTKSIMMYFMPGRLNSQGVTVHVNNQLTDMDRAYMVINYTRNIPHPKASDWTLEKALNIAGVPPNEQRDILACADNPGVRSYFASWNKEAHAKELAAAKNLQKAQDRAVDDIADLLTGLFDDDKQHDIEHGLNADPSGVQHALQQEDTASTEALHAIRTFVTDLGGAHDAANIEHRIASGHLNIRALLKHTVIRKIIKNELHTILWRHGIHPNHVAKRFPDLHEGIQFTLKDVFTESHFIRDLGPRIYTDCFGTGRSRNRSPWLNNVAYGLDPNATDEGPDTQHFILPLAAGLVADLVGTVVGNVITQHGLNPNPNPPAKEEGQPPEIQHFLLPLAAGLVMNLVGTVVGNAITQRGLNPNAEISSAAIAPGVGSESIQHAINGLVDAALVQHGVNPHILAANYPEVQHRIKLRVASTFKNPAVRDILGSATDAISSSHFYFRNGVVQPRLTGTFPNYRSWQQRGLNAESTTQADGEATDIEHGILSTVAGFVAQTVGSAVGNYFAQRGLQPTAEAIAQEQSEVQHAQRSGSYRSAMRAGMGGGNTSSGGWKRNVGRVLGHKNTGTILGHVIDNTLGPAMNHWLGGGQPQPQPQPQQWGYYQRGLKAQSRSSYEVEHDIEVQHDINRLVENYVTLNPEIIDFTQHDLDGVQHGFRSSAGHYGRKALGSKNFGVIAGSVIDNTLGPLMNHWLGVPQQGLNTQGYAEADVQQAQRYTSSSHQESRSSKRYTSTSTSGNVAVPSELEALIQKYVITAVDGAFARHGLNTQPVHNGNASHYEQTSRQSYNSYRSQENGFAQHGLSGKLAEPAPSPFTPARPDLNLPIGA